MEPIKIDELNLEECTCSHTNVLGSKRHVVHEVDCMSFNHYGWEIAKNDLDGHIENVRNDFRPFRTTWSA